METQKIEATDFSQYVKIITLNEVPTQDEMIELCNNDESIILEF